MTVSIHAFLSYLILLGSAYVQAVIIVPNCTDSTLSWVGCFTCSFCINSNAVYRIFTGDLFLNKVVQFAPTKSLLCRGVPGSRVLWLSVHIYFWRIRTILSVSAAFTLGTLTPGQTYSGPNVTTANSDQCNCNTVVYSVISACAACQQGGWPTCVEQLCRGPYSEKST